MRLPLLMRLPQQQRQRLVQEHHSSWELQSSSRLQLLYYYVGQIILTYLDPYNSYA